MKAPHHKGTYHTTSRRLVAQARANPLTVCWRCGKTLDQHEPHRNGRPAYWTAGHTTDGQIEGHLAPEASTCNYTAGAKAGNTRRQQPPRRTTRNW